VTESMKRWEGEERTSEISAIGLSPSFDTHRHPAVTQHMGTMTHLRLSPHGGTRNADIFLNAVRC
jgi:hypothetical protein